MVSLSSIDLSKSLIASYQNLFLFYYTSFDGIRGVLTDGVEWHQLDSNLLQGQKLDPQVDTHIYELIRLVHR